MGFLLRRALLVLFLYVLDITPVRSSFYDVCFRSCLYRWPDLSVCVLVYIVVSCPHLGNSNSRFILLGRMPLCWLRLDSALVVVLSRFPFSVFFFFAHFTSFFVKSSIS